MNMAAPIVDSRVYRKIPGPRRKEHLYPCGSECKLGHACIEHQIVSHLRHAVPDSAVVEPAQVPWHQKFSKIPRFGEHWSIENGAVRCKIDGCTTQQQWALPPISAADDESFTKDIRQTMLQHWGGHEPFDNGEHPVPQFEHHQPPTGDAIHSNSNGPHSVVYKGRLYDHSGTHLKPDNSHMYWDGYNKTWYHDGGSRRKPDGSYEYWDGHVRAWRDLHDGHTHLIPDGSHMYWDGHEKTWYHHGGLRRKPDNSHEYWDGHRQRWFTHGQTLDVSGERYQWDGNACTWKQLQNPYRPW